MTQFSDFPENSRIWIYQASRELSKEEVEITNKYLNHFTDSWTSHNQALKAEGTVLFNHFVILIVDESQATTGGCSIDSSVQFIRKIGVELKIDFFDRMTFAYQTGEEIHLASKAMFTQLFQEGKINDETIVFDNLVKNKGEFSQRWLTPLKDSWHKRFV